MGYYMRFYDTDPRPLRVADIRAGLRRFGPEYAVEKNGRYGGILTYAGDVFAHLEINGPRSRTFREEQEEMIAGVRRTRADRRKRVEGVLRAAARVVFVRVLGGDDSLDHLDCLWDWLFDRRPGGLLHAEGEGFYEGEELILAVK